MVPPWLEVGRKWNDRVVDGLWVVASLILTSFFSLVVVCGGSLGGASLGGVRKKKTRRF